MHDISDEWKPFVSYVLRVITFIGAAPAVVVVYGYSSPNPWISFAAVILIGAAVLCSLNYLENTENSFAFIGVPLATIGVAFVTLFSSYGTGSIAEIASLSFFAAGPLSAMIVAMHKNWQIIVVTITTCGILVLFLMTLWEFPNLLVIYLSMLLIAWSGTGIIRYWMVRAIAEHEQLLGDLDTAVQTGLVMSERESQRRYSARQLHDTVLSTLTMLAHSGKGINPTELRDQAGSDAQYLVSLRKRSSQSPRQSEGYHLEQMPEPELGHTLETVRSRFKRAGLEVHWNGEGSLHLPREITDVILAAISECLENVRRHAEAEEAFVTLSVQDDFVRAIIADQGIGFDQNHVQIGLGLSQSVIGRMQEIGGSAKIFSIPAVGTTVILEAPTS